MKRVLRTLEFLTITYLYPLCNFKNNHYNLHLCKFSSNYNWINWGTKGCAVQQRRGAKVAASVDVILLSKVKPPPPHSCLVAVTVSKPICARARRALRQA